MPTGKLTGSERCKAEKQLRNTEQRMEGKGRLGGADAPTAQNQGTMPVAPLEGSPPESGAETKQSLTEVEPVLTAQVTENLEEKACGIRQHRQIRHASCCHS